MKNGLNLGKSWFRCIQDNINAFYRSRFNSWFQFYIQNDFIIYIYLKCSIGYTHFIHIKDTIHYKENLDTVQAVQSHGTGFTLGQWYPSGMFGFIILDNKTRHKIIYSLEIQNTNTRSSPLFNFIWIQWNPAFEGRSKAGFTNVFHHKIPVIVEESLMLVFQLSIKGTLVQQNKIKGNIDIYCESTNIVRDPEHTHDTAAFIYEDTAEMSIRQGEDTIHYKNLSMKQASTSNTKPIITSNSWTRYHPRVRKILLLIMRKDSGRMDS